MSRWRLALGVASIGLSALSCSVKEKPEASKACATSADDAACEACCTTNGTNAHDYGKKQGCTCKLRYWIFLQ